MQSDILDKIVSILITKHSNIVREEQIFYERDKKIGKLAVKIYSFHPHLTKEHSSNETLV